MKLEKYKFIQRYFLIALFSSVAYCLSAQITSYPYTMGFESGEDEDWTPVEYVSDCTVEWGVNNESGVFSSGTDMAQDGSQFLTTYFYNCPSVSEKTIEGPEFNLGGLNSPEFSFYYHMYGSDMGTIDLELSIDNGATWSTSIWDKTEEQHDSKTMPWTQQIVDLSAYAGQTIKLRFRAVKGGNNSSFCLDAFTLDEALSFDPPSGTTDVMYEYDASGNREGRTIVVNLLDPSEQNIIAATRSMEKEDIEDPRTDLYKIYPNPTSNYVHIDALGDQNQDPTSVTLFDMMGRRLMSSTMSSETHKIDLTEYQSGSYVLWIQSGDTVVTRKIMKY